MHSVSPVHIRVRNQLKNPMTALSFEELAEKKKKVQIGPSIIINESKKIKPNRIIKKNPKISSPKRKPAFQWTTPKQNKKCDLNKTCRLGDFIKPVKANIDKATCEVCVEPKSRSSSRSCSPSPIKLNQNNCSFLKRLSSSVSPVSLNRSQEIDPNSTYSIPSRSRSHESYLNNKENELLPLDENDLILKKEFLIKNLINTESFASDITKVLELIHEYMNSNYDTGLDLKTVFTYLSKDITSLHQLIDLFHLTHKDLRSIINEFLNSNTLSMLRHVKENESILKKLECLKQENSKFKQLVADYEKNICKTGTTNEALNIENNVLANLKQSLEDNRAHLRRQLIAREAECNRLGVQIRNLNRQLDRAKMEIELLRESREKAGLSKLKFANQTSTSTLNSNKPQSQKSASTSNLSKINKLDKTHFTFEEIITDPIKTRLYIEKLNNKLKEKDLCIKNLNEIIIQTKSEPKSESTSTSPSDKINSKSDKTQIAKLLKENEKLRLSLQVKQDKLKNALKSIDQLKNETKKPINISNEIPKKNENHSVSNSSDDASSNIQKSRSESPRKTKNIETSIQREKNFSEIELNNVRSRLQQRLNDLEPLPELLKNTELKLHDALNKVKKYEDDLSDNRKIISDLKAKLEMAYMQLKKKGNDNIEEIHKKILMNNSMASFKQQQIDHSVSQHRDIETLTLKKLEPIERRIQNLEEENKELIRQLGQKDDLVRDLTNKLSIKSNEASSFSRQLDLALSDSNLKEHQIKEKYVARERNLMAKLNELESKLRSMELHSSVDKRDKDEMSQDYLSQIRDLKSKLEQTQQTNRQMQEYVNFLKNSYISYFNDNTLHSFDCPGNANFLSGTSSNILF
ncbi:unnamed protein product [Brachionus calyciflorus]|uniref:BHLH domain-containing protein n=1 Tax=Brachionus calyciflorus TaxID=104777 RepID=A0A813YN41_9BILA|nr:unnamed protein product [Brachionus calyciflorus]